MPFNSEGRLTQMAKQEGDRVTAGETIAALDPATYEDGLRLALARRDAAQAQLDKLLHGTRPEDIDQARANLAAANAAGANAEATYYRQKTLVVTQAVPQQAVDDARRALDTAHAQIAQTAAALAEAIAGPRIERTSTPRAPNCARRRRQPGSPTPNSGAPS